MSSYPVAQNLQIPTAIHADLRDLEDGDLMQWSASEKNWLAVPPDSVGGVVETDGITITGNGTGVDPVRLLEAFTDDDTTEGSGVPGDEIKVKKIYVNGTDMTGNGATSGTAIALATQPAVTTGATYVMNPRIQINTKGIITSAETLTAFQVFWKGTQNFTNGGTFPNWIDDTAGTINNNFLYYNGGMFNGVSAPHLYGPPVSGMFSVTVSVDWTPVATGYRALQLIIQKTSGGAFVELFRSTVSGSTTSDGPHHSITWTFPCAAQCNFGIKAQQDSGSTMTNVPVAVTIMCIQGPIGT